MNPRNGASITQTLSLQQFANMRLESITKTLAPDFRPISPEKSVVLSKPAAVFPVLFWLSLFGILLAGLIIGKIGSARSNEAFKLSSEITSINGKIKIIDRQIEILTEELGRAETLYSWVSNTPMVQPFVVGFFEAFSENDTLSRFSLTYSPQVPGQFAVQTVYQGDAPSITTLFQKSTVAVAKNGWNLALAERSVEGNTVSIQSFARVMAEQPWARFGLTQSRFEEKQRAQPAPTQATIPTPAKFPGKNPFLNQP